MTRPLPFSSAAHDRHSRWHRVFPIYSNPSPHSQSPAHSTLPPSSAPSSLPPSLPAAEPAIHPDSAQDPGLKPKKAKVLFNNGVTGEITLSQATYKAPLDMKVDLKSLKDTVGPWHIHRLPVVSDCSANSTSGHYNPFMVASTYKACADPADCEAGDLATKFGPLTGGDVTKAIEDPKLTLFGFNR